MPKPPSTLNLRRQAFVNEYLIDLNATQAAIRAGYSVKTAQQVGSRLLLNVVVGSAIMQQQAERSERTKIDQDWVLQTLKRNVERAMQEHPVFDRKGEATGEYAYEGAVANKGLELIGEHLRMWNRDNKQINFNNYSWRFTIGKGYDETDSDKAIAVVDSDDPIALRDPR